MYLYSNNGKISYNLFGDLMSKNFSVSRILPIVGIIFFLCSAGCINTTNFDDARLLLEFQDQGNIYVDDIESYMSSEASLLGVNPSSEELSACVAKITKKYAGQYNPERDWYEINWNEFHLSIGRAYGLTDDEIRRYVEATSAKKVYAMHNQSIPKNIYANVLDSM